MMDINVKLLQWSINDLLKKNLHENLKELHEPIIKKFEKKKVYSPFIDNISSADLADMQLTSKFNK